MLFCELLTRCVDKEAPIRKHVKFDGGRPVDFNVCHGWCFELIHVKRYGIAVCSTDWQTGLSSTEGHCVEFLKRYVTVSLHKERRCW